MSDLLRKVIVSLKKGKGSLDKQSFCKPEDEHYMLKIVD